MVESREQNAPRSSTMKTFCSTSHETKQQKDARNHADPNHLPKLSMNASVTFFEIVTSPHQLHRSHSAEFNPKGMNKKPKIIAIIEDNTPRASHSESEDTPSVHDHSVDAPSFSYTISNSPTLTSSSCDTSSDESEDDQGIDELDGSLLPDFFTYTSAEREFIRNFQPLIFQKQRKSLSLGESSETSCFWAM